MMTRNIRIYMPLIALAVMALAAVSCSTTRRLGAGETRYTGVGKFNVETPGDEKAPIALVDGLKEAANCDANDYVVAPFIKIPLGLWVYNNWNDSAGGLKGWLYNKLVKAPVLISEVRPEMRVKLMEQILDNNGYFGSTATYDIRYSKTNKKKAGVDYEIRLPCLRTYPYRQCNAQQGILLFPSGIY